MNYCRSANHTRKGLCTNKSVEAPKRDDKACSTQRTGEKRIKIEIHASYAFYPMTQVLSPRLSRVAASHTDPMPQFAGALMVWSTTGANKHKVMIQKQKT